jgi:cytochrome c biogenesis protein CcmG, thiol:disulfide interchange protein DsbE
MIRRQRLLWSALAGTTLVALALPLAAGLRADPPDRTASASAGPVTQVRDEAAPPLVGATLAGGRFDLSASRGQVVVVNVWASWCAPCRQELPLLATIARQWTGQGVLLVGLDVRDEERDARDLLAAVGATDLTVLPDPRGTTAVGWGVSGVPETFIVDRTGRVRVHAQGAVTADWLGRQLDRLATS